MFNCSVCHIPTGPRVSPIPFTTEVRPKMYTNTVEEEIKTTSGTEIVKEVKLCPSCVEKVTPKVRSRRPYVPVSLSIYEAKTDGCHRHAKKCDGTITIRDKHDHKVKVKIECPVCKSIMQEFSTFPAQVLDHCLSEIAPPKPGFTLGMIMVLNAVDRAQDGINRGHLRGTSDAKAAFSLVKDFQGRGGRLQ